MKRLGFGKALQIQTRDALQGEFERLPDDRRTWSLLLRLRMWRIISRDPGDTQGILSDVQALKLVLVRLENLVQSGEAQK